MQITAEIERYDEANTRVRVNFYRSWAKRIILLTTLEEVPEDQATAIVSATNRLANSIKPSLTWLTKYYGDTDEDC